MVHDAPVVAGIAEKDPAVLDYALEEAERRNAPLRLVHAYIVPPSTMGSIYGLDIPDAFRDAAEQVLKDAVEYLEDRGSSTAVETSVVRGAAAQALDRISHEARSIVIGPNTHKPWAVRLFEGRTARHLVEHALCPVVVVPDAWEPTSGDGAVIALLDQVSMANAPLRYAFDEARRRGARVRVVQADTPFETAADLDAHREHLSRNMESWRAWYPDVHVRTTVLTGRPEDVAFDSENGAELLVVSRSVGGPHLWPSTPAARTIAEESRCPVVVVPPTFDG